MDENESEGKLSRNPSQKKIKKDGANDKKLKERVEEFKLWSDDNTFKSMEYDERRSRKERQKGIIRSDKRLRASNLCYIPSFITITVGCCLLLLSSIEGLIAEMAVWDNKIYFQIAGGALLVFGLLMLMTTAAYTYRREDTVRNKFGFPSLYEATRSQKASLRNIEETLTFTSEFVDRSSSRQQLSRMTSLESKVSLSNLGCSFSSASTTMSWIHKHKKELVTSASFTSTSLRRDNSDSALETFFARNRVLSWQVDSSVLDSKSSGEMEKEEGGGNDINQSDVKSTHGNNDSHVYSSSSTTSSGYHSNISSPTKQSGKPSFIYSRSVTESVSEQCDTELPPSPRPVFCISDEDEDKIAATVTIPLVPIIKIEEVNA